MPPPPSTAALSAPCRTWYTSRGLPLPAPSRAGSAPKVNTGTVQILVSDFTECGPLSPEINQLVMDGKLDLLETEYGITCRDYVVDMSADPDIRAVIRSEADLDLIFNAVKRETDARIAKHGRESVMEKTVDKINGFSKKLLEFAKTEPDPNEEGSLVIETINPFEMLLEVAAFNAMVKTTSRLATWVPDVYKPNAKCYCGSGKKRKQCHNIKEKPMFHRDGDKETARGQYLVITKAVS